MPDGAPTGSPLLEARAISKRFGGVQALHDVTMAVEPGEIFGLVGPNGAGKTTLFNCLCGQLRPDGGSVRFDGHPIDHLPTYRRARLGIGRTFQRIEVFPELSVRDHLFVAARAHRGDGALWKDLLNLSQPRSQEVATVEAVLDMVRLQDVADTPVAALSLGHCRLVELGRALAGEPRLLMADEPSSGLDVSETQALADTLLHVRQEHGTAVILVEHDLDMVAQVVDRVIVLDFGQQIAAGTLDEVLTDPVVRKAYLGKDGMTDLEAVAVPAPTVESPPPAGPPLLEFTNVSASYSSYRALFDVSFSVPERAIVALLGSNGAGKSTVARVATGLVPSTSGSIRFGQRDITRLAAHKIAHEGVAHVPEGRGIFSSLTVEENLTLAFRQKVGRGGVAGACERAYTAFPALVACRRQMGGTLSGGQQRMLSLARVLAVTPRLLIVDELSLGLAPVVIDAVYEGLLAVRDSGCALLVVEQQVDRALAIADAAVLLAHGSVAWSGPAAGASAAMDELLSNRQLSASEDLGADGHSGGPTGA